MLHLRKEEEQEEEEEGRGGGGEGRMRRRDIAPTEKIRYFLFVPEDISS